MHFDTEGCDVLLFEFTSKVALDEGGLQRKNVSNLTGTSTRCELFFFSLVGGGDEEIKPTQVGQKASTLRRMQAEQDTAYQE